MTSHDVFERLRAMLSEHDKRMEMVDAEVAAAILKLVERYGTGASVAMDRIRSVIETIDSGGEK